MTITRRLMGLSRATANGAFLPMSATVPGLPAAPLHVAHRGNYRVNLENTLSSFRASVAQGARIIKLDVYTLADGSLGVMHDNTVNRTTTSTGSVAGYNATSWRGLVVPASLIGAASAAVATDSPPLLEDVLNEFGGKVILMLEQKDDVTGAGLLPAIVRRGLQKSVIVINSDSTLASVAQFVTAGVPVMFQYNGLPVTAPTPATVLAAGVSFVDIGYSYTDADIQTVATACSAAHVRLFGFSTNRRAEAARLLSLGCTDIISNASHYTAVQKQFSSVDRFANGVPMVGQEAVGDDSNLAGFIGSAGAYRRAFTASPSTNYEVDGWLWTSSPTAHTITGTFTFDALDSDATRFASLLVCSPDDFPFANDNKQSGYHLTIRQNGQPMIYRTDRGAITNGVVAAGTFATLATGTASPAITAGQALPFTAQVTSTQVKWTINGQTLTATDSTYRAGANPFGRSEYGGGCYTHFGKSGSSGLAVSYSGISITPTG